ncbi:DUF2214 family protein [Cognatilysobacter terrigena]|uniref:DUF2214 family protein n=1 Tax=Cognatilysobacter terrigena TaxID=2488749 RepID=UPI0010621F66|nr:DUF2214 family protein [Lysobacter terrigena]
MWHDFLLASAHHVLVVGLIAMLAAQMTLLRGDADIATLQRLGKLDRGYGSIAGLLLVVGLVRVFHGIKGEDFYLHNPWFHAKLGAFLLAAAISIVPTVMYARWRKAASTDPSWRPGNVAWSRARLLVRVQFALIVVIVIAAAGMARYGGL